MVAVIFWRNSQDCVEGITECPTPSDRRTLGADITIIILFLSMQRSKNSITIRFRLYSSRQKWRWPAMVSWKLAFPLGRLFMLDWTRQKQCKGLESEKQALAGVRLYRTLTAIHEGNSYCVVSRCPSFRGKGYCFERKGVTPCHWRPSFFLV